MADYDPPIENLPIFDTLVFKTGDEFITQRQADKRYLRYPNAQGTENLQSVNISGTLTASGNAIFNNDLTCNDIFEIKDATTSGVGKVIFNIESTGTPLSRLRLLLNPGATVLNPMTQLDDVLMCYGTSNPNPCSLTIVSRSNVACGIRLTRDTIIVGSGGSGTNPNNRINITPSTFQLIGGGTNNNVSIDNNLVMSSSNSNNRNISTTYLNFNDIANNSPVAVCFVSGGGVLFFDNNVNNGQFGFTVNDSGGTQRTPLIMSANAFTIASINPPTTSATIPANDNTTAIATTSWVQSLVSIGRTQTVQITSTSSFNIPSGVIGIGIRMIGRGGFPGTNSDNGSNYNSGGTGGGASSITSNGMIPLLGGTQLVATIDAVGVTLTTNSVIICNCRNGLNGGNATVGAAGAVSGGQSTGSSNANYGSFSLLIGNSGVAGVFNAVGGSVAGVPTIASNTYLSSPSYQTFIDGQRGCGQRYAYVSGNGFPTSTTVPAGAIIFLTYYYI